METQGMEKEHDMQPLNELIRALSEPEVSLRDTFARSARICKICGKSARRFRDSISEFEYRVSAICQQCQDRYFG
jgi:phosphoribosyl-dephospho-CoA transferase